MSIEYDEKGKFYTDVVTKVAVSAVIQTTTHFIRGFVHVRQGERIKDELERDEHFLAVTEAVIQDAANGRELFKTPFMAIRREQIVWIMPAEENGQKEGTE
jgi:hypothetical protein